MHAHPPKHAHYTSAAGYRHMMTWYNAALAHIQVPYVTDCVPTRYGETHLVTAGAPNNAPPIVLLHGININAAVWVPQFNGLAAHSYVIAPDVPGFAGKSSAVRFPYQGSPFADWLADVLDALGIDKAIIVGGSAGGWFALKFAAYYPQRAAHVLAMNPCGIAPYRHMYKLTRSQPFVTVAHKLRRLVAHEWVARRVVQRGMNPTLQADRDNIELAYLLLRYYTRRISPPLMPGFELQQIHSPVTLLMGEREIYTNPQAVIYRLSRELPALTHAEIIPTAGHDLNKERPALVNRLILDLAQRSVA